MKNVMPALGGRTIAFFLVFLIGLTPFVFGQDTQVLPPELQALFASGPGSIGATQVPEPPPILKEGASNVFGLMQARAPGSLTPPGRMVVGADDWFFWNDTFSSTGAGPCALNIVRWLTKGKASPRVLIDTWFIYYVPQSSMIGYLGANGCTVTTSNYSGWTYEYMAGFDAVFLGRCPNVSALTRYFNDGGGIYFQGGNTYSPSEFNGFLGNYGMGYAQVAYVQSYITSFFPHPVTAGVSRLFGWNPTSVNGGMVLSSQGGINWLAAYEAAVNITAVTASPPTLLLKRDGSSAGITFRATADGATTVTFKVRSGSQERTLGSVATHEEDSAQVADYVWNGRFSDGTLIATGSHTIVAQGPANQREAAFEVTLATVEVTTVEAFPGTLYLDEAGAGSGIVFKATTTQPEEPARVSFKVIGPDNREHVLGDAEIETSGSVSFAKKTWWGYGPSTLEGVYQIVASVDGSNKQTSFTVKKVGGSALGMGKWMQGAKDPKAVAPADPQPVTCPQQPWETLITAKPGHGFSGFPVGDPVHIAFGNYILPVTDLSLKARFPLVLARVYNSLDPAIGPFGRGWSSPLFTRLEITADTVVFVNSDGSRVPFQNQQGNHVGPTWTDLRLSFSPDTGFWTVSHPTGAEWTFDGRGKITRLARACCGMGALDALSFDYDGSGRLTRITNPNHLFLDISYDARNLITAVVDSTGRTVSYGYDQQQNLIQSIDPLGRPTVYAYENGFLSTVTQPGNRVTAITYVDQRVSTVTEPNGAVSRFTWDFSAYTLTLTDVGGTVHAYEFTPEWQLKSYSVPDTGSSRQFAVSDTAVTEMTDTLGAKTGYSYTPEGLLHSITDAMGHTSVYEWHPTFHKLTRKTDTLARVWEYAWCYRGNLVSEKDPAGGMTTYTYDAFNNRTGRTDPLGRLTRYEYDAGGNHLIRVIDAMNGVSSFSYDLRGNLISASDPLGRVTRFQYDLLDRLTKTVYPDGRFVEVEYNDAGNVSSRRDHLGRETRYEYDLSDRLTVLTRPDGTAFQYAYNAAGQKISETDPLNRMTRFEYSPVGLLIKTIYPDGAEETFAYDTESRLVSKTNELGQTTNLEYDQMGRLLATIDPTGARWESQYDAVGRKIADKGPLNRVSSYQYDVLDRVTKVTRPDNSFVTNSFDAVGNLLSTVDALGKVWSWQYDNLNRQVKAVQPNGASSTTAFDAAGQVIAETDALSRVTRYTFDLGGRRTSTTDALGNIWRNTYDAAGRLIAVKDPLNAVFSMAYDVMDRVIGETDPLGNTTRYECDGAGRRVARVDAQGRRTITVYDDRDRVLSEADAEGRVVSYGYDLAGRRVRLTDGANRVWRWELDSLGRVIAEIDPIGSVNRYAFDSVGNRSSWTNARNQITNYTFDPMNRLSLVTYHEGTIATLAYDLEGRELSRSGPAGSVGKTWDTVGNMTSETFGPWGKTWRYSFDLGGNLIKATDPEGKVFSYSFDKLNRIVALTPPEKGDGISFSYDKVGRLVNEKRLGTKTTNTFDSAGRLLELKHERDSGNPKLIASRKYTYSPVGNRLTMLDEEGQVTRYFYDNADWLTQVRYPDGQRVSYLYNGAGDRTKETIETPMVKKIGRNTVLGTDTVVIPFTYDPAGRMVSRGSDTFAFDADGNQVSAGENGEETRYVWSSDNRLLKVERDLECSKHGKKKCKKCPKTFTVSESYGYEPESWRRLTRTTEGLQFVSVYAKDDESHEYLVTPKALTKDWKFGAFCWKPTLPKLMLYREFVGGPGTDDIEATKYHGRSLWLLKDALGSTIALTNRGGHAVARIGYDAWGNLKFPEKPGYGNSPCREDEIHDWLDRLDFGRSLGAGFDGWHWGKFHSAKLTPYLFASRRRDGFSGQYFHRNRYYQPKTGRFTSRDLIGFAGGPNLWAYPRNPVSYTDPYGLKWVPKWLPSGFIETEILVYPEPGSLTRGFVNYYLETREDWWTYEFEWEPEPDKPTPPCGETAPKGGKAIKVHAIIPFGYSIFNSPVPHYFSMHPKERAEATKKHPGLLFYEEKDPPEKK